MGFGYIHNVMLQFDPFFIFFFRLTGLTLLDFYIGVFMLAMGCVVIGEVTLSLALRFNRNHLDRLEKEITHRESLSIQAYQMSDRPGYSALNKAANDAWGKHFFTMAAYSAGMLWPAPFAMAWLNTRFQEVPFPLPIPLSWIFGESIQYPFIFIIIYILCRILFKYARPWLPYFRQVQRMLDSKQAGRLHS
ncbi:MAG: hypothetical protein V2B19_16155 [Pseudomonadota bacterium]